MSELLRHRIDVDGVGLSVLELGAAAAPPLGMLHGMRDVAWSLLPVAAPLAERYRVRESRIACFTDAEHRPLAGAGHMVHYDQAEALTAAVADFLERRA